MVMIAPEIDTERGTLDAKKHAAVPASRCYINNSTVCHQAYLDPLNSRRLRSSYRRLPTSTRAFARSLCGVR